MMMFEYKKVLNNGKTMCNTYIMVHNDYKTDNM